MDAGSVYTAGRFPGVLGVLKITIGFLSIFGILGYVVKTNGNHMETTRKPWNLWITMHGNHAETMGNQQETMYLVEKGPISP